MRSERYLTEPHQYAAVYGKGRSWVSRSVVLKAARNSLSCSRYGLSVGRRVGKAVTRNRVKRRLREIMRHLDLVPGWDLVLIVRPAAADAGYGILEREVLELLFKAGVLRLGRDVSEE